ncbi:MAG: pentapeptide repeat-containing protein [Deltaproteobacteria bacterium]|jgi:uncharacterized protein YjbI with pentapeptide repeats|nr:pentapeptide repeat-containing protein [Deltaproteobacteria bacterium]
MTLDPLTILAQAQNSGQPVVGLDLGGQDLDRLNVRSLVFDHCRLVGARIADSSFLDCLFQDCDFSEAVLVNNSFSRGRFIGPLTKVNFNHSVFKACSFDAPLFSAVDWSRTSIYDSDFGPQAKFSGCVFSSAIFGQVKFGQTVIKDSRLDFWILRESSFGSLELSNSFGANFQAASLSLRGARAVNCDLTGANFQNSDLTKATLKDLTLVGAFFANANLAEADLSGAEASRAIFQGANLTGANLTNLKATYADFSRAHFAFARLKGADLTRANFHRAKDLDLRDAAQVHGARLTDEALARAEDFQPL